MQSRGFSDKWIAWIKLWLFSSSSCITINGTLTPYFSCKRVVRQVDPLSPYLFNLAVDTLSKIFKSGRDQNILIGLGPFSVNSKAIINCHYADDTILFLKATPHCVSSAW